MPPGAMPERVQEPCMLSSRDRFRENVRRELAARGWPRRDLARRAGFTAAMGPLSIR